MKYIFVHGLSGWGSYDERYAKMPYWGMRGGDLMQFLRALGFECFAASVSPAGSAWDRACELYAQLAGTRTDYGAAHCEKYGHERFGRDFSGKPLIDAWNRDTRIVLIGHSFGGTTVRMLSKLMAEGDEEELKYADASELFRGGMEERIHAIVTIASPMNGTAAYDMFEDPSFDPDAVRVPLYSRISAKIMSAGTKPVRDGRDASDYAGYDMHIDNAHEMNRRIPTLKNVYYFSVPCAFSRKRSDGAHMPKKGMEPLFVMRSLQIGCYSGSSRAGIRIDDSWRRNDGLVNTVSAMIPSGAAGKAFDEDHIEKGIWNVLPVFDGDHMHLQGGLVHRHDVRDFYIRLLGIVGRTIR